MTDECTLTNISLIKQKIILRETSSPVEKCCDKVTGLPTMDETVKTTQGPKLNLKFEFWFLHSMEYFDSLLNDKAQK